MIFVVAISMWALGLACGISFAWAAIKDDVPQEYRGKYW